MANSVLCDRVAEFDDYESIPLLYFSALQVGKSRRNTADVQSIRSITIAGLLGGQSSCLTCSACLSDRLIRLV